MNIQQVNQEIAALSITISNASNHRRCDAELQRHPGISSPVGSLQIPNGLFILWTRKLALGYQQYNKHSTLVNESILEGCIKITEAKSVEVRLQKVRSRVMNRYKALRKGSRTKFKDATTHVLLFENETYEATPSSTMLHSSAAAICQNSLSTGLQFHGKTSLTDLSAAINKLYM